MSESTKETITYDPIDIKDEKIVQEWDEFLDNVLNDLNNAPDNFTPKLLSSNDNDKILIQDIIGAFKATILNKTITIN